MKILPAATPLSQPYWDAARAHRLVFQRCRACANVWHPPMPICPACHAADFDWQPAAGGGSVYTYTIVHHPTHPAFQDRVPYIVAVVELDEGPRIVINIKDCSIAEVCGGMRVSIVFEDVTEAVTLPQARPA
ncbi:MAG TPA: Zn-ribbon domain-containing OB-fold protein [Chloroflexota bacterium]